MDTLRVNKLTLESAQMLCTALYVHVPEMFTVCDYSPLKKDKKTGEFNQKVKVKKAYYFQRKRLHAPSHKNHPSNCWTRATRSNYKWLLVHMKALAEEYYLRRGKWHKSYRELFVTLSEGAKYIPEGELTPFVNCAARNNMGISYKHIEDTCEAYKMYLKHRWELDKKEPVWT